MQRFFEGEGEFEFGKGLLDVECFFVGHGAEGLVGGVGVLFEGLAEAVVS